MKDVENKPNEENKGENIKPDPETLHTTDPQKNMEGPISSLMHKTGHSLDSDETKKEADDKKEKGM